MKKIAIIGASYLQLPLIKKAKEMGIETHVFAWAVNDVGEKEADFFYPISIIEKEKILDQCLKIRIDGVCSIASDLASITVGYIASKMGLTGNSMDCCYKSTDKHKMRNCFEINGDSSPFYMLVNDFDKINFNDIKYPVIVKPIDRSGSRGITKCNKKSELYDAIVFAKNQGFSKSVLIEEFVEGQEYSVESISWQGHHQLLAITYKYTTESPNFIETAHLEPAPLKDETYERIKNVVLHALDSLGVEYGASHSEIKIKSNNEIKIIEIGARMGGDMIGSHLVFYSTGYDFVRNVIQISLGEKPEKFENNNKATVAIRYIMNKNDYEILNKMELSNDADIICKSEKIDLNTIITDSSNRIGYYVFSNKDKDIIYRYLPSKPRLV